MTSLQANRHAAVTTTLGEDVLLLRRMRTSEAMGRLFEFELELLSEDHNLDLDALLGQAMSVRLALPDGEARHFHGHVGDITYVGSLERYARYQATLRPWLWFLTRTADCRIFQNLTVPEIVKAVFRDSGFGDFEERLSGYYHKLEYCVQYRESAFDFVSRLMEREGLYYYFRHQADKHLLVLSDSLASHDAFPGFEELHYLQPDEQRQDLRERVYDWCAARRLEPGAYATRDFDFTKPRALLDTRAKVAEQEPGAQFTVYDFPGGYLGTERGEAYARLRLEAMRARHSRASGETNARGVATGCRFSLVEHPREDQNREYLVVSATQSFSDPAYHSTNRADDAPEFNCSFEALDSAVRFRPQCATARPRVEGPQTAVVVGPAGEAVCTDEFGRVKIRFHWDYREQDAENRDIADEQRSCWVRVSQSWAGNDWGAVFLPHVGQEVIVDFLEGDPDRPIVTGRVYNADNMPLDSLPAAKYRSGLRDYYGNELIFDATPGDEHIRLRSPHQDSAITLGKSVVTYTKSDDNKITLGNAVALSAGSKITGIAGVSNSIEIGMKSALFVGTNLGIDLGHKVTMSWSSESRFVNAVAKNYAKQDILSISGEDHIIGAGDQLCLIGGADGKKATRSIVNLYPESISLTVGGKQVVHKSRPPEVFERDQLYKDDIPSFLSWKPVLLLALGAVSTVSGAIARYRTSPTPQDTGTSGDWDDWKGIVTGITGGVIGSAVGAWSVIKSLAKKPGRLEPVEHEKPTSQVELNDEGVAIRFRNKQGKLVANVLVNDGILLSTEQGKNVLWLSDKGIALNSDAGVTIVSDKKKPLQVKTPVQFLESLEGKHFKVVK